MAIGVRVYTVHNLNAVFKSTSCISLLALSQIRCGRRDVASFSVERIRIAKKNNFIFQSIYSYYLKRVAL